jgi:hypothetical protein
MFGFKRKYVQNSLEAFDIFFWTKIYLGAVFSNYLFMHSLRSILSPLGINGFILGYCFLSLFLLAQEIVIGDPVWRTQLLALLATQVIFDGLMNLEPFYFALDAETEHYTSNDILCQDHLTVEERSRQLRQQGKTKEAREIDRLTTMMSECTIPMRNISWVTGVMIKEKQTGNCWRLRVYEAENYEVYPNTKLSKHTPSSPLLMAIFQEIRDRRLSLERRQQVWKRLQKRGVRIEPCQIVPGAQTLGTPFSV